MWLTTILSTIQSTTTTSNNEGDNYVFECWEFYLSRWVPTHMSKKINLLLLLLFGWVVKHKIWFNFLLEIVFAILQGKIKRSFFGVNCVFSQQKFTTFVKSKIERNEMKWKKRNPSTINISMSNKNNFPEFSSFLLNLSKFLQNFIFLWFFFNLEIFNIFWK